MTTNTGSPRSPGMVAAALAANRDPDRNEHEAVAYMAGLFDGLALCRLAPELLMAYERAERSFLSSPSCPDPIPEEAQAADDLMLLEVFQYAVATIQPLRWLDQEAAP